MVDGRAAEAEVDIDSAVVVVAVADGVVVEDTAYPAAVVATTNARSAAGKDFEGAEKQVEIAVVEVMWYRALSVVLARPHLQRPVHRGQHTH